MQKLSRIHEQRRKKEARKQQETSSPPPVLQVGLPLYCQLSESEEERVGEREGGKGGKPTPARESVCVYIYIYKMLSCRHQESSKNVLKNVSIADAVAGKKQSEIGFMLSLCILYHER